MAAVAAVGSLILGAYGAAQSADAARQQGHYQSAVARNNATIASLNAAHAREVGQQQENAKREQTAQMIGRERAVAGASNVDSNTGSPLKIQSDTAKLGELDALTIRNNAARQAWNYESQQGQFGAEAGMFERAGNLEAMSSMIGGASSVAGKWSQYQTQGVFSG
jgi:hypothetical protein